MDYKIIKNGIVQESNHYPTNGIQFHLKTGMRTADTIDIPNRHNDFEFLLITEGEGTVLSDMRNIECREGDLIVVNSGAIHNVKTDTLVSYILLFIGTSFLEKYSDRPETILFCDKINDIQLNKQIREMKVEYLTSHSYRTEMLTADIDKFVCCMMRNYQYNGVSHTANSIPLSKIKNAVDFIMKNLSGDIDIDNIASYVGLSKFHFCREFKKATERTVINFITSARCEKAKSLLATGKYTVSDISAKCGFASSSYFSKTFKKYCGMSPREFTSTSGIRKQ